MAGNTTGIAKEILETFSVFAFVAVPTFAPKIDIPALACPSMPDSSLAVTATSKESCSIGRISSFTTKVLVDMEFGNVGFMIAPLSNSACSSLTAFVMSLTVSSKIERVALLR